MLIDPSFPFTGSSDVNDEIPWCKTNVSEAFWTFSTNEIDSQACARDFGNRTVFGSTVAL